MVNNLFLKSFDARLNYAALSHWYLCMVRIRQQMISLHYDAFLAFFGIATRNGRLISFFRFDEMANSTTTPKPFQMIMPLGNSPMPCHSFLPLHATIDFDRILHYGMHSFHWQITTTQQINTIPTIHNNNYTAITVLPWPLGRTRWFRKFESLPGIVGRIFAQTQGTSRCQDYPTGVWWMPRFQGQHYPTLERTRGVGGCRLPTFGGWIHGQAQGHRGNVGPRDTRNHVRGLVKNARIRWRTTLFRILFKTVIVVDRIRLVVWVSFVIVPEKEIRVTFGTISSWAYSRIRSPGTLKQIWIASR